MAWNSISSSQMVSYLDASTCGISLVSGQSHITTLPAANQCMTKANILSKYSISSSVLASYTNDQLVPKSAWPDGSFKSLGQANLNWNGIAAAPNGDIYACVLDQSFGFIHKQTGGIGNFVKLETFPTQVSRTYSAITVAPNGKVYASVSLGNIFTSTSGASFASIAGPSRRWTGLAAAPNGDVYACVSNGAFDGDIYKQTGGVGDFIALNQTPQSYYGLAAAPNGDIYVGVSSGYIYKQTGGTGNFVKINNVFGTWYGLTVAPNGDAYAVNSTTGDIYIQTGGIGEFIPLGQYAFGRLYYGLAAAPNGAVYACSNKGTSVAPGDIFKRLY